MVPTGMVDYLWFHDGDDWWVTLIKAVIWAGIAVLLIVKSVDHVDTGQQALRRRFGKVVKYRRGPKKDQAVVVNPGFIPLVPFVHSLWKLSVLKQQQELRAQIRRNDHGLYQMVNVKIFYRIVDIEKALVDNHDANELIVSTCEQQLCQLIDSKLGNLAIESELASRVRPVLLEQYGAELMQVLVIFSGVTDYSQFVDGLASSGVNISGTVIAAIAASGNGQHNATEAS